MCSTWNDLIFTSGRSRPTSISSSITEFSVVPRVYQDSVAIHAHVSACGHAGVNRTFDWVRLHFWWPGYYKSVKSVAECTTCQVVEEPKGVALIEGRLKPQREFEVVGLDLLKLPESADGYTNALVVVDHFTRFAWVRPIKNKEARTVLSAFVTIDMPLSPTLLVAEFKNKVLADYCGAFGIRQHFCTPYHPQSDGVVERFNRSLGVAQGWRRTERCSKLTRVLNSFHFPS